MTNGKRTESMNNHGTLGFGEKADIGGQLSKARTDIKEIEMRSDPALTDFNKLESCQTNLSQIYDITEKLLSRTTPEHDGKEAVK